MVVKLFRKRWSKVQTDEFRFPITSSLGQRRWTRNVLHPEIEAMIMGHDEAASIEFQDGDKLLGTYGGNEWTRADGLWYFTGPKHSNDYNGLPMRDETAEWLMSMTVHTPVAKMPDRGGKISKTEPQAAPVYQYRYTYKPKDEA